MCWKSCLMKAKAVFAVLVLSMQKGKLTKFQIILMEWFLFFFSLSFIITGKGEGISMLWINLK